MISIIFMVFWQRAMISFVITIKIVKRISTSSHDSVKFVKVQHSVSISISLFKHFLELIVRNFLTNFSSDSFQVLESDFIEIIFIKQFEDFQDFFFGVTRSLNKALFTIRAVMTFKNSLKLSPYLIYLPISAQMSLTSCFLISIPKAFMIALSYLASIYPK